jgi:hypothetical protein
MRLTRSSVQGAGARRRIHGERKRGERERDDGDVSAADPRQDRVGIDVAEQQDALKEHHTGRPHLKPAAISGQQQPARERLQHEHEPSTADHECMQKGHRRLVARPRGASASARSRFVMNFRYVGGGKAIGSVLHKEEYGADFDFTKLAQDPDAFWASTPEFHRLWMFDIDAGSAAPVTGIDDFEFVNPSFFHSVLDGRIFVFLGDGNSGTINFSETVVYELDRQGHATVRGSGHRHAMGAAEVDQSDTPRRPATSPAQGATG